MRILFGGIPIIAAGLIAAWCCSQPTCDMARRAVEVRDVAFVRRHPHLFTGAVECQDLGLLNALQDCDDFAETLLELDASLVNRSDGGMHGTAPLDRAVNEHNATAVAWLADKGASLNRFYRGEPPLGHAACKDDVDVVRVLVQKGADVNRRGWRGHTPLMEAIYWDRYEVFQILLPLSDLTVTDGRAGRTALFVAIESDRPDGFVQALLDAGANVHIRSTFGHTILTAAIEARASVSMIRALVDAGADIDARGPDGRTILTMAAEANLVDSVNTLLAHGASVTTEETDAIRTMKTRFS